MNQATLSQKKYGSRPLGIFVVVESLLIWVPLIVLGAAIEWPASLSVPAPVVELFGMEIGGLITFTTSSIHIWWLVIGGYLIANGREPTVESNP